MSVLHSTHHTHQILRYYDSHPDNPSIYPRTCLSVRQQHTRAAHPQDRPPSRAPQQKSKGLQHSHRGQPTKSKKSTHLQFRYRRKLVGPAHQFPSSVNASTKWRKSQGLRESNQLSSHEPWIGSQNQKVALEEKPFLCAKDSRRTWKRKPNCCKQKRVFSH